MGIISTKAHTIIGLFVGFFLILAPYIFNFSYHDTASATATWIGILIILSELVTKSPYSPIKLVPMKRHIFIDILTGLFLAASPWLFNFMDSAHNNQWVPHLVFGMLIVGYALLTDAEDERTGLIDRV